MQHFLTIAQLSRNDIDTLLARAKEFKYQDHFPHYPHHILGNLFYENSTRTRVSFELAAKHLAMPVINVNLSQSSESKGESIEDTVTTLTAMGLTHFVIRHKVEGLPQKLAGLIGDKAHIINAGDGQHAHPSQALLDLMTISEHKPNFNQLKVAILGDIRHSRVANSLQELFKEVTLGELIMVAPALWHPKALHYGRMTTDIDEGLVNADVVICLRVQQERLEDNEIIPLDNYQNKYMLTLKRLALAKSDALILHPGPINRGVEIDNDTANCGQSYILQQVKNGIYMRMAILERLSAPYS